MAVALAVTLEEPKLAARLNVTAIPAAGVTLTIERVGPSGIVAGVRGATGADVEGTTFLARDYELPLDVPLTYTVRVFDAGGAQLQSASASFEIDYAACEAWLVDLARPLNSLQLTVESLIELSFAVPSGIHRVLNRRSPVVTALPASTPSGLLNVLTETLDERDAVRALLGSGYPFLLRTTPEQGIGNAYFALTEFAEERLLTLGVAPERRFRISCQQVERPNPSIYVPLAPNSYDRVKAAYATYAALAADVASYDELAYTYPSGITNPILPWPPEDV